MNEFFNAIILGLVQGVTEFLPISSSGHLVLMHNILDSSFTESLFFDVSLHIATTVAICLYFKKDIIDIVKNVYDFVRGTTNVIEPYNKIIITGVLVGTIPAGLIGVMFGDYIENVFRNPESVAYALLAGSVLFMIAEKVGTQDKSITTRNIIMMGVFQTLALIPGMSRSGSTISGGLLMGLTRKDSARISFLLALPIIVGAGLKTALDIHVTDLQGNNGLILLAGAVTAGVTGYYTIVFLMKFVQNNSLYIFALYRIILAIGILLWI